MGPFAPAGEGLSVSPKYAIVLAVCLALSGSGPAGAQFFSGENSRPLGKHTGGAAAVDFSPDGKRLASAGGDRVIRLWDTAAEKELHELQGHQGFICCVAFAPDGKLLASSGHDKEIYLWDVPGAKLLRRLDGHPEGVRRVVFSPDGRRLASGGWDR